MCRTIFLFLYQFIQSDECLFFLYINTFAVCHMGFCLYPIFFRYFRCQNKSDRELHLRWFSNEGGWRGMVNHVKKLFLWPFYITFFICYSGIINFLPFNAILFFLGFQRKSSIKSSRMFGEHAEQKQIHRTFSENVLKNSKSNAMYTFSQSSLLQYFMRASFLFSTAYNFIFLLWWYFWPILPMWTWTSCGIGAKKFE